MLLVISSFHPGIVNCSTLLWSFVIAEESYIFSTLQALPHAMIYDMGLPCGTNSPRSGQIATVR